MTLKREPIKEPKHGEEFASHLDYQYWYKEDGERTATKLPVDPYHTAKYVERGWTKKPPRDFVQEAE